MKYFKYILTFNLKMKYANYNDLFKKQTTQVKRLRFLLCINERTEVA